MFIKLKENSPVPSCAIWLGNSLVKKPTLSNKVMKFTTTDGNTWNNTGISAYTADNRLIEPVKRDATGWTYDENVGYIKCSQSDSWEEKNLLTFEGFPQAVKLKLGANFFSDNGECTDISTANMDTSECTNMSNMFNYCTSLTSLDVSKWNTSQVTDMSSMFSGCSGLTSLDLSNFNTSQVTDMGFMFSNCSGLTSLDLSNFNTSQVTSMSEMFSGCTSLASLDLSNWDTSKVTNTDNMFLACGSLTTVKMTNCSQDTKDKIRAALDAAGLTSTVITE